MSAALLEYALGNTLLAAPLAALAWALGRSGRCPAAAHLAWALVLVRLVMPPITDVPWLTLRVPVAGFFGGEVAPAAAPALPSTRTAAASPAPVAASQRPESLRPEAQRAEALRAGDFGRSRSPDTNHRTAATEAATGVAPAAPAGAASAASPTFGPMAPPATAAAPRAATAPATAPQAPRSSAAPAIDPAAALAAVWLAGAALVAGWSLCRVVRFHRALAAASAPAGAALVGLAAQSARALRMPAAVRLRTTTARTSPFVWWCFGRPTIVLPTAVVAELPERELRLAITHELAHVRRRDHVLRWFEWAATAWLWWHPLAWLARRALRVHEELACDALVLRTVAAEPRDYGSCLLSVAESLASPGLHPPAQACAMSDGGALAQRLAFILSDAPRRRPALALHALPLAATFASLGLGVIATAQEPAASPAKAVAPAQPAVPAGQGERPAARTFRATIAGAKGLDVETMQGDITVRRDAAAAGLEIRAAIRRAPGDGGGRFSAAEFEACVRGATLVTNEDDQGMVTARVVFPDAPTTDADDARAYEERRDSSCEIEFVVRTNGLANLVARSVSGDVRVDGDVGAVSLSTVRGDVVIHGTNGAVAVESVSGDIDVRGATAAVSAASVSGDVRVGLAAAAKDQLAVESTSGSIELSLSLAWQGTWRASSTTGTVLVDGRQVRAGRDVATEAMGSVGAADAARARLTTVTGAIRLTSAATAEPGASPTPPPAPAPAPAPPSAPAPRGREEAAAGDGGPSETRREVDASVRAAAAAQAVAQQFSAAVRAELRTTRESTPAERAADGGARRGEAASGAEPTGASLGAAIREIAATVRAALAESGDDDGDARASAAAAAAAAASEALRASATAIEDSRAAIEASLAAVAEAFASTGAVRAELRHTPAALQRQGMRLDGSAGNAPSGAAGGQQIRVETTTIEVHAGKVRLGVERLGPDGTFDKKVYEAPAGPSTIELGDDGAVRVTIETIGADGTAQKKVCEAPDLATFQRQHPGVLVERAAVGERRGEQDPPADRKGTSAK